MVQKNDGGEGDSACRHDGDDDGWVHGGRYVPAAPASSAPSTAERPPRGLPSATPAAFAPAASSPYSLLSLPPLNTPLPPEATTASAATAVAASASSNAARVAPADGNEENDGNDNPRRRARTPLTVQLRRLLAATMTPASARADTPADSVAGRLVTAGAGTADVSPLATPLATPAATPANASVRAAAAPCGTPEHSPRGRRTPTPMPPPPATPVEKFLRDSGVTPGASRALGNAALDLASALVAAAAFLLDGVASRWDAFTTKYPHAATDVVESFLEMGWEIGAFLWNVVRFLRFLMPYVLWSLQTLIALTLTVSGTLVWSLAILIKGREKADESGAGEVHHSAVKSLVESVRKSPFRGMSPWRSEGGRLPFAGFSNLPHRAPQILDRVQPVQRIAAGEGNSVGRGAGAASLPPAGRSATPSGGAVPSAARGSILRQRTPYAAGGAATPASTNPRRVLFSKSEGGGVSTEQFEFDKHLPASARKVDRRRLKDKDGRRGLRERGDAGAEEKSGTSFGDGTGPQRGFALLNEDGGMEAAETRPGVATPSAASATVLTSTSMTPENAITQPSQNFERNDVNPLEIEGKRGNATSAVAMPAKSTQTNTQTNSQPATSDDKKREPRLSEEEEKKRKQQYIQRYGLLPTITPLSKRYGRMKQRQRQQGQTAAGGLSASTDAAPNAAASGKSRNVSRKRRGDLLGAASRLGRHRRARIRVKGNGSSMPTMSLANGRTPTKRRRDGLAASRADEWVWRAMNCDGKENQDNEIEQGGVAKRSKFVASENGVLGKDDIVGTPPKNSTSSLPRATTPPKTPGPLNFAAAATPTPRKSNGAETPSVPLFSFGAPAAKGDVAALAAQSKDGAAAAAPTMSATTSGQPGESSGAAIFASTEKKTEAPAASTTPAAAPGFKFGAPAAAAAPAATEKKDAGPEVQAFSFGNNQQGKPAAPPASGAAFAFGATAAAAPVATVPAAVQFSFGASSQPTPGAAAAQSQQKPAPPSSGATFSFGATAAPAPAAKPDTVPAAAQFSFGALSQPAPGGAAARPQKQLAVAPTAAAGATPSFSFGAGAASAGLAPAPPLFGTTPTGGASFSLGGLAASGGGSRTSARRRAAKGGGRRR